MPFQTCTSQLFLLGADDGSRLIAVRLGAVDCLLCAAPSYLTRCGTPTTVRSCATTTFSPSRAATICRGAGLHDEKGRPHEFDAPVRLSANDPKALHRMVLHGAGISASARYMALPEIERGALVRVLLDWTVPSVDVSLVTSASRERSPAVGAFVDFMRETTGNRRWFDG